MMLLDRNQKVSKQKAFTLLEVLVAMAVLTIGMLTLVKASSQNTIQTAYLQEKTLAQWVAINKVNEVKLASDWPAKGSTNGIVEDFANQNWKWNLKISEYGQPSQNVRQLTIDVSKENVEDAPLISITTFVSK